MQQFSIIDPFNLRDFIKIVVEFLRQNDDFSSIRTTLDFLEILLDGVGEPVDAKKKPKPISDVQKVLSGNISWDKLEYILDESEQIHKNCKKIADEIEKNPHYCAFLNELVSRADRKFFEDRELENLSIALNTNKGYQTQEIVYIFLCHGLHTLNRIPAQLAHTLYDEAQTLDYNQPMRYALLKEAAAYGCREAALEFGNYANRIRNRPLSTEEIHEAFTYTMMAVPLNPALWNLAFLLEQDSLSKQQIQILKDSIKIEDKIAGLKKREQEELHCVVCLSDNQKREAYELAYKINFYLAYKGFTKSYNSLAKYLSLEKYGFQLSSNSLFEKKDDLIEYYYRKAIAGGNVLAMHNFANKLLKQKPMEDSDVSFTENLLKTAIEKGMNSSYSALGLLYMDGGKPDQAKTCLLQALEHSEKKGMILYNLGILEPKLDEKVKFFLKAIQEGYADAAIDYALCEHTLFNLDEKTIHLRNAINILQQFAHTASVEKRNVFIDIQNNLEEILEKVETDR